MNTDAFTIGHMVLVRQFEVKYALCPDLGLIVQS